MISYSEKHRLIQGIISPQDVVVSCEQKPQHPGVSIRDLALQPFSEPKTGGPKKICVGCKGVLLIGVLHGIFYAERLIDF